MSDRLQELAERIATLRERESLWESIANNSGLTQDQRALRVIELKLRPQQAEALFPGMIQTLENLGIELPTEE